MAASDRQMKLTSAAHQLKHDYPWIKAPVVVGAPMRLIADVDLTLAVSNAGGIGFLAGGTDISQLSAQVENLQSRLSASPLQSRPSTLPFGIGFITWGAPLDDSIDVIEQYKPSAVWLFAPKAIADLVPWCERTRAASPETRIWIQVGTVGDALEATELCQPDVLVLQGQDAGGHGRFSAASIVSLIPEVVDRLHAVHQNDLGQNGDAQPPIIFAAGGVMDSRGAAAALTLGAQGVVLGTRLLAAQEAVLAGGYRAALLASGDGGVTTVRTKLYDTLRGTTGWPEEYGGRGVTNLSWEEAQQGVEVDTLKALYNDAMKEGDRGWGFQLDSASKGYAGSVAEGRMTIYAGTGVGLLKTLQPAKEIVDEVRKGVTEAFKNASSAL